MAEQKAKKLWEVTVTNARTGAASEYHFARDSAPSLSVDVSHEVRCVQGRRVDDWWIGPAPESRVEARLLDWGVVAIVLQNVATIDMRCLGEIAE